MEAKSAAACPPEKKAAMPDPQEPLSVLAALRRLGPWVRPFRGLLLLSALLLLASLAFDLAAPLLLKELIDQTLGAGDLGRLNSILLLFAGLYLLKFGADLVGSGLRNRFDENVVLGVRRHLYESIQRLSQPFFQEYRSGYLTSRILSDTTQLGGLLGNLYLGMLSNLVLLGGAVAITAWLNWRLTVLLLLVVPLLAFLTKLFAGRIQAATRIMQEQISQLCAGVQENVAGMSLIQSYTLEGFAAERVGREMKALRAANVKLNDLTLLHRTGTVLMTSVAGLSILFFGSRELLAGHLTMGSLMAFLAYAVNVYRPVQELLTLNLTVQRGAAAAGRVFELLDEPRQVAEAPGAPPLATPVRGAVELRGVSFAYGDEDVLENISFSAAAGQKVAVVGRSGAGKTTLLSLLPRFFDPRRGEVLIDGQSLAGVQLASLRRAIAVVSQDTFLFSGSIRENLSCVAPEAGEERLLEVLRLAQLDDLLERLPDGLDTEVGERGLRLSGGERQRLSIARALLKDPPILVLDEATSSVDSISENRIRLALDQVLAQGRTCFVIAHRFSTILDADQILVLEEGRLVGQGRHAELYGHHPVYTRLYDEQFAAPGPALPPAAEGVSIQQYLMKNGDRQSRILVRSDGGRKQVEISPLAS